MWSHRVRIGSLTAPIYYQVETGNRVHLLRNGKGQGAESPHQQTNALTNFAQTEDRTEEFIWRFLNFFFFFCLS